MTEPTALQRRNHVSHDIESELEQAIHNGAQAIREGARMPKTTPIISTKARDLDDLGRMSAEAVLTQYEAAAKAVEEMGKEVTAMVKRLGEKLVECDQDMKHIVETAAAIREKGKHSQALIEQVSALSSEIRKTCDEFIKKVGL